MEQHGAAKWMRLALLALAGLALLQAGCAAVAIGAAAAAAGAGGYAYWKGQVNRDYAARPDDVRTAARTALTELGMPVVAETSTADGGVLESRTARGDAIQITLNGRQSQVPTDGPATQVGIRVALFGDLEVSERILDQIGYHLVPSGSGAAAAPRPMQTQAGRPPETAPPPLAPEPTWRPKPEKE